MSPPMLLPVDHVIVYVSDLEAARQAWIAAGFVASPISRHDSGLGTANSCIMFEGSYIELMGVFEETPANAGWRALGAAGPGLRGVALRSAAIEDTEAGLAARGVAIEPIRRFARRIGDDELRFSVIRLESGTVPGLKCLFCQHHTPTLLWTPELMRHPNGARSIVEAQVPGAEGLRLFADLPAGPGMPVTAGPGRLRISGAAGIDAAARADLLRHCGLDLDLTKT